MAQETKSPNERPRVGCIGNGGMGSGDANSIKRYGDIVANCDVDKGHAERLQKNIAGGKSDIYEDYRELLDRKAKIRSAVLTWNRLSSTRFCSGSLMDMTLNL